MKQIQNLLKNHLLHVEYQPLIDSRNESIIAYEALLCSSYGIQPTTVFEKARKEKMTYELDTFTITHAVNGFPSSYLHKYFLFISIFPTTITHPNFMKFITLLLKNDPAISQKIVFEINDIDFDPSYWKKDIFFKRMNTLKKMGFQIAFEDLQAKKQSFKKIEVHSPQFIKLDSSRFKGFSISKEKQELMILFLEFAPKTTTFILGGIETKEDYTTARQLEIPLLQGNFISKPMRLSTTYKNAYEHNNH